MQKYNRKFKKHKNNIKLSNIIILNVKNKNRQVFKFYKSKNLTTKKTNNKYNN